MAAGRDADPGRAGRGPRTTCWTGSCSWTTNERPASGGDPHRGADQAVRAGSPRSTGSTSTSARATSTGSSAPTARARPRPSGCCSAWCWPRRGGSRCSARQMPRAGRRVLPQVGALVEGPAAYPHLSGRRNLALFDAMAPGGDRRGRGAAGSAEALERVGLAAVGRAAGARVLARHAAAARAGRRAAAAARGCWCSTSRPTAWTRRASRRSASCCSTSTGPGPRSSSPATCWPRSSSCAPGSASSTAAGWSCRTSWRSCAGRPAGSRCTRPTSSGSARLLDGVVEEYDGERLLVREATRRRSTRGWCGRGSGSPRLGAERRTLEEVVLAATTASADRFGVRRERGGPVIRVELVKLLRQPPDLGDHRAHRRAAGAGRGAAGGHRPRPAAGHRARVPVGGADRRHAVPAGRARHRAAAVPADRGGDHGRGGDRRRGPAGDAALPAGATGRPDPAAGRQARRGHGVRRADRAGRGRDGVRPRDPAARRRDRAATGPPACPGSSMSTPELVGPHLPGARLRDALHARGRGRARCSCPRSPSRRWARPSARWRCWSRRTLLLTLDAADPLRPTCRPATGWRSSTCSATRSCGATSCAACVLQVVYVVVFLGAGWANFMTKDVTD